MKSIAPFIQTKVVVLYEDDSLYQAARAMQEHRIGCVVVSDHKRHVVGILTDRDIVSGLAAAPQKDADETPISDIPIRQMMTRDPVTVDESEGLARVIQLMSEHGVRRLPVLRTLSGEASRCVGLVTLDDLISNKALPIEQLSQIVRAQLKRRIIHERGSRGVEAFYEVLARKLDPKAEFTRGQLEALTYAVLGGMVRRLHHTAAMHLISLLPAPLQETFLAFPPGPDETVNLNSIGWEISQIVNTDEAGAFAVLLRFGALLDEWCDPEALHHVKAQLPKEFSRIFVHTHTKDTENRKAA